MRLGAAGRRETEQGTEEIADTVVREAIRRRSQSITRWTLVGAAVLTLIACLVPF